MIELCLLIHAVAATAGIYIVLLTANYRPETESLFSWVMKGTFVSLLPVFNLLLLWNFSQARGK